MPTRRSIRTVFTYCYLYYVAWSYFKQAQDSEEGRLHNCMVAMVFYAFSMEAYLNHIGHIKIGESEWERIERKLRHRRKLLLICRSIGIEPSFTCRPFKTYNQMFKYRDTLAHARTIQLKEQTTVSAEDLGRPARYPQADWEQAANLDTVQTFHDDTTKMIRLMHKAAHLRNDPLAIPWLGVRQTIPTSS